LLNNKHALDVAGYDINMCYSGQSLLPRKSSIDKYKAFNNSWLLIIPNTSPSSMSTTALQLQNISAEHLPVCVQFQNITLSFFLLQIFSRSILVQAFFHFFLLSPSQVLHRKNDSLRATKINSSIRYDYLLSV